MRRPREPSRYSRSVPYEVTTPVFEGPFDLLLHLIAQEEVDVYEVSISRIVDAYLAELERMQTVDLEVATEFLLIAATLIELKTRRLLPGRGDADLDEELALWEERDLLLARLLECKTFKDAAQALLRLAARAELSQPRRAGMEERFLDVAPDILAGVTPERVRDAFLKAVAARPVPRVDLDHVAPIRLSVRDAVDELAAQLPAVGETTFRLLAGDVQERLVVIVRFLAVLEMYKEGLVDLDQGENFGELRVRWLGRSHAGPEEELTIEEYQG